MTEYALKVLKYLNEICLLEQEMSSIIDKTAESKYIMNKLAHKANNCYRRLCKIYRPARFTGLECDMMGGGSGSDRRESNGSAGSTKLSGSIDTNSDTITSDNTVINTTDMNTTTDTNADTNTAANIINTTDTNATNTNYTHPHRPNKLLHYKHKYKKMANLYTLNIQKAFSKISKKYNLPQNDNSIKSFFYWRDIYRYLRFYADATGIKYRHRKRGGRRVADPLDILFCMACKKAITRKMLEYHIKAIKHIRNTSTFTFNKAGVEIFDCQQKYGRSMEKQMEGYRRAISKLMPKAVRSNTSDCKKEDKSINLTLKCDICDEEYSSDKRYFQHFKKEHIQKVIKHGAIVPMRYYGIYTYGGMYKMQAYEREIIQTSEYEEVEDGDGNVYDKKTYVDLLNNGLL